MGIGSILATVLNVNDLESAELFWSELTGLPVITSGFAGRFSYLGQPDPWKHELTLQLVTEEKGLEPNRAHLDLTPEDGIDAAIVRIVELGGTVKRQPSIYPRPGTAEIPPLIDWAVLMDPFGNEFCLVDRLSREQREAVHAAAVEGSTTDLDLRVAAGLTSRP